MKITDISPSIIIPTALIAAVLWLFYSLATIKIDKPVIKPCRCLTYYEMQYYSTKYDMYIDSINHGSKKNRQRYADSTVKFGKILRQTQK